MPDSSFIEFWVIILCLILLVAVLAIAVIGMHKTKNFLNTISRDSKVEKTLNGLLPLVIAVTFLRLISFFVIGFDDEKVMIKLFLFAFSLAPVGALTLGTILYWFEPTDAFVSDNRRFSFKTKVLLLLVVIALSCLIEVFLFR